MEQSDTVPLTTTQPSNENSSWDVIIVGAGIAGVSAAYHLSKTAGAVKKSILILDAGALPGEGTAPRHSGSATMKVAPCIKMMVQIYAGSSKDMIRHHGQEGAKRYLQATKQGLEIQKTIAKEIWSDPDDLQDNLKELGSYYLGYESDQQELKQEFETLRNLGCDDIEWCDVERLKDVTGLQSTGFTCGIYFPKDAIIDSSLYAKRLLQYSKTQYQGKECSVTTRLRCKVETICEDTDGVQIHLDSGDIVRGQKVVVATGALFQLPDLNGLLMPCYSYLVHVPISTETNRDFSPNFFTWGFTHDWCFTNGKVRISGEDHFSAYKPPHATERCSRLAEWTLQQYKCSDNDWDVSSFPQQYGLYSETPDMVPLVGPIRKDSRICYLLGCNAWGQAILSYCASLVPGVFGFDSLDERQQEILELVSIQRFQELPANQQ
ncbi:FAD dependent oxidoreductase [Nitzschia inconspicua]|uniref:Oxidoreductase n=1 Tax=Nitzschia inconspicua TaxID=303405 RepID=A0A9K3LSR0_9STRA|nr:oxidoreductase [Nitzschia inconspicua]KAG7367850.1 FAD dependent oxidoreductase [Nitzschia inconspicua]